MEELKELYYLMVQEGTEDELEELMRQQWESGGSDPVLNDAATQLLFAGIRQQVRPPAREVFWNPRRLAGVAASIILFTCMVWLALWHHPEVKQPEAMRWVTKSTANGQRAKLTLRDGSIVTLNAGSSISYPEHFEEHIRQVKLTGEAFFEVQRDPTRPFTVESQGLLTTVLGTSFNIRSFSADDVEVTVATGKVRVAAMNASEPREAVLIPNQQARFNAGASSLAVAEVDIARCLAWRNNELYFNMMPFEEVIATLERWYGVEISLENTLANRCPVRARYRNEALSTVLDGLRLLVSFDYEIVDDQHLKIKGRSCEK